MGPCFKLDVRPREPLHTIKNPLVLAIFGKITMQTYYEYI